MTSHSKLYFSDKFSPGEVKYDTLLIQIRNTDFSVAIIHENTLIACGKYFPFSEITTKGQLTDILHTAECQNVIIGIAPEAFNIVPRELYSDTRLADFARMLDVQPLDKVYSQTIDENNQLVFKDNNEIMPLLAAKYPNHQVVFAYKAWLKVLANNAPDWTSLYLDVQLNALHIAYFREGKLRFYNSFNYASPEDLVYFTALTSTELRLNAVNIRLVVSGDVVESDRNMNALAEFFTKIEINKQKPVEQLPGHVASQNLLSLTALIICA